MRSDKRRNPPGAASRGSAAGMWHFVDVFVWLAASPNANDMESEGFRPFRGGTPR